MVKRGLLLILVLSCLNTVFCKVIISSPKTGVFVSRELFDVLGVSDESGSVELSLYDPSAMVKVDLGSVTPDIYGFWNASIDFSVINGSSVYLIASTMLDKSSVLLNLRDDLILDLTVPLFLERGESFLVSGEVSALNGSVNINSIPLIINDSVNVFSVFLERYDNSFITTYSLPLNAMLSNWSVMVNYSSDSCNVVSDVEFFEVLPTNLSISLISDHSLSLGSHEVMVHASYPDGRLFSGDSVNAVLIKPGFDSFIVQFDRCGDSFCKNILFDQSGEWSLGLTAEEFGNYGFFNTSIIVSDELTVNVVDSSLLVGDETSFLVSVSDADGLISDGVSFSVDGLPANVSRVVNEGSYFRVFLDLALPPGVYDFSVSAVNDYGSVGSTNSSLIVNDLIVTSCVNGFCTNSSSPIVLNESVDLVSGSVSLSDGSIVEAEVEFYVNGMVVNPELVDDVFSGSVLFTDGFMLVLARYDNLVRSNSFVFESVNETIVLNKALSFKKEIIEQSLNVTLEFPGFIKLSANESASFLFNVSNNGLTAVNLSFDNSSLPFWIRLPSQLIIPPNASVSDIIIVDSEGVSDGVYPVMVAGLIDGSVFSENMVLFIEESLSVYSGNLSVGRVSFDMTNSGLILEIKNSDSAGHELIVYSSGDNSSVFVDAFDTHELFIPFSNLSDLSLTSDESVVFSIDSYLENVSSVAFTESGAVSFSGSFLIIAYPIFVSFIFGLFYSKNVKNHVVYSVKGFKRLIKRWRGRI